MSRPPLLTKWSLSAEANAELLRRQVLDLEVRLNDEVEKSVRLGREVVMLREQLGVAPRHLVPAVTPCVTPPPQEIASCMAPYCRLGLRYVRMGQLIRWWAYSHYEGWTAAITPFTSLVSRLVATVYACSRSLACCL